MRKPQLPARPNLIVATCCLSVLLVGMDVTIVNVALPAIQHDIKAPISGLQWVLDSYTVTIAGFLMLAGSLSDRFGRRLIFLCGIVIFTLGSLGCAVATSATTLIASRGFQGLGGSMLNPVALSIITNTFPNGKERARALGIWSAVFGVSLALGPLLGGLITQTIGWRFVFLINVPIGIIAIMLVLRFVPESKAPHSRRIDKLGQILLFATLTSLTYAIIEGPRAGWNSRTILSSFLVAAAAFGALIPYEHRQQEPLLEVHFFRNIPFSGATLIAASAFSGLASVLFLSALYLQQVRAFTAFHAGLFLTPLALAMMLCAPVSGWLVSKRGTRLSLILAGLAIVGGSLLSTHLNTTTSAGMLVLSYLCFGIGIGMVNPAISTVAMSGMPMSQSGVAAAIASTSRAIGSALGIAVSGAIVAAGRAKGMGFPEATHAVWWTIAGSGALVAILGWLTNSRWAQDSILRQKP